MTEQLPKTIPVLPITYHILNERANALANSVADAGLAIGETGGTNDFHDNAAFDEANRLFDLLSLQSSQVHAMLKQAEVVTPPSSPPKAVTYGASVGIKFVDHDLEETRIFGSPIDAKLIKDAISDESPIGAAIAGKSVGDIVEVETPAGTLKVEITSLSY